MEENTKAKGTPKEPEIELHDEEHSYDGIVELDHPPPRWIMAIFYLTIGFSIIYAAYFFWLDVGPTQDERYAQRSELHDAKYQIQSESEAVFAALTSEADLAEGKQIYTDMACMACHGIQLEGNAIGPNLVDEYWISGCSFEDVFNIIKNGNVSKGMTAFKMQLSDARIQKVASYVVSLQGTNPPNAKAAQGDKCE